MDGVENISNGRRRVMPFGTTLLPFFQNFQNNLVQPNSGRPCKKVSEISTISVSAIDDVDDDEDATLMSAESCVKTTPPEEKGVAEQAETFSEHSERYVFEQKRLGWSGHRDSSGRRVNIQHLSGTALWRMFQPKVLALGFFSRVFRLGKKEVFAGPAKLSVKICPRVAPPIDLVRTPLPAQQVKTAPPTAPAMPTARRPPAPPPMRGPQSHGPPPPPMMMMGKGKKPSQPLKSFFWTKLPQGKITGTIWEKLAMETCDTSGIEKKFAKKRNSISSGTLRSASTKKIAVPTSMLNHKRLQNAGIALARLKLSIEDIQEAVGAGDDAKLPSEKITMLLQLYPTSDEIAVFEEADALANPIEVFMMRLATIPNLKSKLESFQFKEKHDVSVCDLNKQILSLLGAAKETRKSKGLHWLLASTLAVGNYMNSGTPRGGASGVQLGSLLKLHTVKSSDGDCTLLDYILSTRSSALPLFTDQLQHVEAASRLDINKISADVTELARGLESVKQSIGEDGYAAVMEEFCKRAERASSQLKSLLSDAKREFEDAVAFFGELPENSSPEDFFGTILRLKKQVEVSAAGITRRSDPPQAAVRSADVKQRRVRRNSMMR